MVSEYLKKNTAEYHDAAEKLFNSEKIFNKTFSLEDYKKIINTNYLMLLHSEDKIFNNLCENFSEKLQLNKRVKLPLIERDLASLALENQTASHDFELANEHEALGAMYVIEGSTLGGNVIAKQLSKTEGFDDVTFNFFGCYQENTGPMWKNFKEVLDTEVTEENYSDVLSGAKKLYTFLLNVN
ncbi:biliverdin-producing heme oxygenase [Chryseobacterium indoltheticum]|uniref:Heme oxygenase n=1 Tax=Chryseobacterium indoltheticum TaxID=254 RepID=A0A381F4V3_9FLAO|nr:biliverdin-producing heme oxygenase [Chryseobacterium indoltheticum]AZA75107.1 heme oxygenase [Chryseobacterium indoltheticum]SIQ55383.1 Heme oxygenase [Chryseobacterium indoltheticum]SUX41576.1 Heme oxygenase [Chryseobacterium indoltheticum]